MQHDQNDQSDRRQELVAGHGRASGANSVVAFCLGITNVDPIELDLYFERFLNSERTSPPDFDIDFSWDNRDEIYDYFFSKYDQFLEISSLQRNFETRCLNQSELKYLIKNDHGKVLNYLKTTTPHHWYLKSYIPISANILELASKYGNIYLIEEILRTYQYSDTDYILYSKCTSNALQKGHLECFRLLRQFNFPIEPYIFIAAAKGTSGTAIFKEKYLQRFQQAETKDGYVTIIDSTDIKNDRITKNENSNTKI